jgi:tetratricopeptide (TPR) repeat protein
MAIGAAPILVYVLFKKSQGLGYLGFGTSIVGVLFFLAGLLQVGPLTDIAYKQSVSYRGDFWRTAFNMIKENLFFGVGFERFGVNYRSYRDLPQVLRNGVDAYSDNAHNIYLQFAATGGFFLAVIYLALNLFIGINFVKKLKGAPENTYLYVSIFGIWLAIQAQSLISVDTPAIALWGWVFAGFLCSRPEQKSQSNSEISPTKIVGAVLAMAFGVLSIFQLNAQTSMRTAFYLQIPKNNQEYADAKLEILQKAQSHEALNVEWPILAANSLIQDEAFTQTVVVAKRAVKLDPKDYRGWFFLASSQEKLSLYKDAIASREAARKIDPYNADNLLNMGRDYKATNQSDKAKEMIIKIKEFAPNSNEYELAVKELN